MILGTYAIKDKKGDFMTPMFELNDANAMRHFEFAVKKGDSILTTHAHDFCLCRIGSFETEKGLIHGEDCKIIMEGVDCLDR